LRGHDSQNRRDFPAVIIASGILAGRAGRRSKLKNAGAKAIFLWALLLACGLSACTLYRAHQDLGDVKEMVDVRGTIEASRADRPLFVGLFRTEGGEETLAAYFVRYGTGPFYFIVPAGSYHLFAFEDANENLEYDDGEPLYYTGDSNPRACP
jgi:hypothetical protein